MDTSRKMVGHFLRDYGQEVGVDLTFNPETNKLVSIAPSSYENLDRFAGTLENLMAHANLDTEEGKEAFSIIEQFKNDIDVMWNLPTARAN